MLKKEILKVIKYFKFFDYLPSEDEIYTFLKIKTRRDKLKQALKKIYITQKNPGIKYKRALHKLERAKSYIRLISLFPQIKLIGLSGSMAMMNVKAEDDVDLFIISAKGRLFTARFIAISLAFVFGLKRSRSAKKAGNKVCLNLFFDERELAVPKFKRSEYVAHEVLQMKPLVIKGDIYQRFLKENKWVFKIFPNAKSGGVELWGAPNGEGILKVEAWGKSETGPADFASIIELILKKIQLRSIKKHQTTEIITDTQLWFHPQDFEKKISF